MKSLLAELKRTSDIISRSEECELLDYLEGQMSADDRKVANVLLVGPGWCGKSYMMRRMIHGLGLRHLASSMGLHYTGIHISAPEYTDDGIQLPQEKKAEFVAWFATVAVQTTAGLASNNKDDNKIATTGADSRRVRRRTCVAAPHDSANSCQV